MILSWKHNKAIEALEASHWDAMSRIDMRYSEALGIIKDTHAATLQHLKETQVVGGQPVHLIEKRNELAIEKVKDSQQRQAYISDEMRKRAMNGIG